MTGDLLHDLKDALSADKIKGFCQVDKGHVQQFVLFVTLFPGVVSWKTRTMSEVERLDL